MIVLLKMVNGQLRNLIFKTISLDNCRGLKLIFCMSFTQPSP